MTNTELAILGLVAEGACYGYQIEQAIEQRGMRKWSEIGFSSIYYILKKLEEDGWLCSEKSDEGDRPARKIYHLTAAGQTAYREAVWQRLSHPRPNTSDFDLALSNLVILSPDERRSALQTYLEDLTRQIQHLDTRQDNEAMPVHVKLLFQHSLNLMKAEQAWLTATLRTLSQSF